VGSASATLVTWLAPVMIVLSVVLLGRAFYVLYALGRGGLASKVITWLSAAFVVGYWTWRLVGSRVCGPG
jgi:hypothetical protein